MREMRKKPLQRIMTMPRSIFCLRMSYRKKNLPEFEELAAIIEETLKAKVSERAGRLIDHGGDYYGPTVNLASRLAELAVPAELLVTPAVAAEARSPVLHFEPAGKRMLKGIGEPVALLTVERVRDRTGGIKAL
jgi:hypothetical protein